MNLLHNNKVLHSTDIGARPTNRKSTMIIDHNSELFRSFCFKHYVPLILLMNQIHVRNISSNMVPVIIKRFTQ